MATTVGPTTPLELVEAAYAPLPASARDARRRLGRPLTFAEKVLFAHADDPRDRRARRAASTTPTTGPTASRCRTRPRRWRCCSSCSPGCRTVAVPTTVHCDHLIQARVGADADLQRALDVNSEVYEFLRTVSAKYGIGFWKPGTGIIHQVVLENYAFPGGMMIGTDSHTPNAGGLGMIAIGVGGADAVDVMAGWPFNTRVPKLIGVRLTRRALGLDRAEGRHPEGRRHPHREGRHRRDRRVLRSRRASRSRATGKATICNMGAEIGATCSLFPYDAQHARVPEGDRAARRSPTSPTATPSSSARPRGRRPTPSASSTA